MIVEFKIIKLIKRQVRIKRKIIKVGK